MRVVWLGLGALPYLSLVSIDAWMHERDRKVPVVERILHGLLAVALIGFMAGAFVGRPPVALVFLAVFVALLLFDGLGFHRGLARAERRVHLLSYLALLLFVAVWQWVDYRV